MCGVNGNPTLKSLGSSLSSAMNLVCELANSLSFSDLQIDLLENEREM